MRKLIPMMLGLAVMVGCNGPEQSGTPASADAVATSPLRMVNLDDAQMAKIAGALQTRCECLVQTPVQVRGVGTGYVLVSRVVDCPRIRADSGVGMDPGAGSGGDELRVDSVQVFVTRVGS